MNDLVRKHFGIIILVSFIFGLVAPFFFVKSWMTAEKRTIRQDDLVDIIKDYRRKQEDIEFLYADIYQKSKGR